MKSLEETKLNEKSFGGDSDTEMLNLEKELFSLTHYADDVEELVSQMFSSIKGAKLQAMLPPILKEIPLIDVQQLCLHELRGMSSRRILSIINGVEMSDSSSEEDDLLDQKLSKTETDEKNAKGDNFESMDVDSLKDLSLTDDRLLTALDVQQLEMRAKLIKNMLNKQPGEEDSDDEDKGEFDATLDPNIKIKEEPLSSDEETGKKVKRRSRKNRSSSSGSSRSSSSSSSSSSYTSRSSNSSDYDKLSQKSNLDESPDSRRHKKKISKKEFEARMKKARMNRTYRKRKDSEDDSANESKRRHRRRKKLVKEKEEPTIEKKETPAVKENGSLESDKLTEEQVEAETHKEMSEERNAEVEATTVTVEEQIEESPEAGEVLEKEEGEIDSNEENYYSDSRSSSYSSKSYSSSPKRHRRHKKRTRRRKTRTPPIPKVPNWEADSQSALPKKSGKAAEENKSLPLTEDRQSVSFSLSKKSVVTPDAPLQNDLTRKNTSIENATITEQSSQVVKKEIAVKSIEAEPTTIPQKPEETAEVQDINVYEISGSEDEDGAVQDNSDADMQDDSVMDPIQNMETQEAELEEESLDVSEAVEEGTTSEIMAEDTSQDVPEPGEEEGEEQRTTEIIGVIDPTDDNANSAFNDASGSSWSSRWLQSEKVQQVVSDSKMLSKMRKNIQAKGKTKVRKMPLQSVQSVTPPISDKVKVKLDTKTNKRIIGGIGGNAEDYENTFGIKVKVPQSLPAPKSQKPVVEPPVKAKSLAATLLDSDDDDDSEDDELWSKIMKK